MLTRSAIRQAAAFAVTATAIFSSFADAQPSAGAIADVNRPVQQVIAPTLVPPDSNRPWPFTGRITGNDVLVRSGPGTDYYQCGKLFKGDTVQVIREEGGWSQIVPPAGSFSWVHMQYVCISLNDPTQAIVTGDEVPVYAGSDLIAPIHSTTRQAILRRGDRIRLLGHEQDGYLKIACPQGAALWVSSRYVEPLDQTGPKPTQPAVQPTEQQPQDTYRLDEFYKLQEQFNVQIQKPLEQQDFTAIKQGLTTIAQDKQAVKASLYAKLLLERVANCELAKQAQMELQRQDKHLAEVMANIEKARQDQLKANVELSRFCVIGRLEGSAVYSGDGTVKRYRILDQRDGRLLCYAQPMDEAAARQAEELVGQKVGLVGAIKPDSATGSALAEFSQAVKLP